MESRKVTASFWIEKTKTYNSDIETSLDRMEMNKS